MRRWWLGLGLLAALLAFARVSSRPAPAAQMAARLALLVTRGVEPESTLRFVDPAVGRLGEAVARLRHLPDAAVRGAISPDGTVWATADRIPVRDRSFGAALFKIPPGAGPILICDGVDWASRPLSTADGRVFVARGEPGAPLGRALRADEIFIDEVDAGGGLRTVFRDRGYQATPLGISGGELIVYLIGPAGASLVAVDPARGASGERRVIVHDLPLARDFTVEDDRIVYAIAGRGMWAVETLNPRTGARDPLWRGSATPAPHRWPGGDLAFDDGRGLRLPGGDHRAFGGPGVDVVRAATDRPALAAIWHYPPGNQHPDVLIVEARRERVVRVAAPPGTRLEIVGFAP